ncbi:MAG TPA: DHHA1 domain-containing protein [Candidatus Paceibacterota bacterium]|nr:DHHA1 domain-containing protein [Candidatus Paceibacterota bacterium]
MASNHIFYHQNCLDGFFSAWVSWKKFKNKAKYSGFNYQNNDSFKKIKNKTVYFIDCSPSEEMLKKLKKENNRLILIDHHLSSEKNLPLFNQYLYNLKHSGCVLSYFYFFPQKKKQLPKILKYIEDIDLWRFKLKNSREICSALEVYGSLNFQKASILAKTIEGPKKRKEFIKKGKAIEEYKNQLVKNLQEKAFLVKFEGFEVLALNSPVLISEAGNHLANLKPPFSLIFSYHPNGVRVSLRGNGKIDVSKIAEKYNGGGHFSAASFLLPLNKELPWKKI